jgi:hypothetical protein
MLRRCHRPDASRLRAIARAASALLGATGLTACTIVEVSEGRAVGIRPGVLRIEPDPASGLAAYRSTGVGLVPGVNGATLGYRREAVVLANSIAGCRVIVFELPEQPEAAALWRELLSRHPDICLMKGEE